MRVHKVERVPVKGCVGVSVIVWLFRLSIRDYGSGIRLKKVNLRLKELL